MWQLIFLQLGNCLSRLFFVGERRSWACSDALTCCPGLAQCREQHTQRPAGQWHSSPRPWTLLARMPGYPAAPSTKLEAAKPLTLGTYCLSNAGVGLSQCSLHNAPIFRLLLKVAVNGTHQCESLNFCGDLCPNQFSESVTLGIANCRARRAAGPPGLLRDQASDLTMMWHAPWTRALCLPVPFFYLSAKTDERTGNHPCGRGNRAISDA